MEEIATSEGPMCEAPMRRRPQLTMARKRELFALAEQVVNLVGSKTEEHERCFLRSAVDMLIER